MNLNKYRRPISSFIALSLKKTTTEIHLVLSVYCNILNITYLKHDRNEQDGGQPGTSAEQGGLLREYAGRSETRSWLLNRGENGKFFGGVLLG